MNSNVDYAALVLRLGLGTMFIAHGLLKVMVFTLPGTVGFFESRAVAVALIPVLLGATYVHWSAGWLFSNENGGWEYPAFLVVATVVQALLGPGRFRIKLPVARRLQPAEA